MTLALPKKDRFIPGANARKLIVAIHGLGGSSNQLYALYEMASPAERAAHDYYFPELPHCSWLYRQTTERIISDLTTHIDCIVAAKAGGYDQITLCGYSFGAIIARAVYCNILTGSYDQIVAKSVTLVAARPWSATISRIVLLAGVHRGWSIESPMVLWLRLLAPTIEVIGFLLSWPKRLSAFDGRRGSPFLSDLRLEFFKLCRQLQADNRPLPQVIQLLGTDDDIVAPDDHIDVTEAVLGKNYLLVPIPMTSHQQMVQLLPDGTLPPSKPTNTFRAQQDRTAAIHSALFASDPINDNTTHTAHLTNHLSLKEVIDRQAAEQDPNIENVVFILHGIRDKGFWTRWLGAFLEFRGSGKLKALMPSYGYFPIMPFLFPFTRAKKVEWFLDQYVNARYKYPNANISFIGHSNGSYLLARSLELTRNTQFDKIVFAGSPVRRRYDWNRFAENISAQTARVRGVLNFVATSDWVVAVFGSGLSPFAYFDLGNAGHLGFRKNVAQAGGSITPVVNVYYAKGTHGAGLQYGAWSDMAEFVLKGIAPDPKRLPIEVLPGTEPRQRYPYARLKPSAFVRILGWAATVFLIPLATCVSLLGLILSLGIVKSIGLDFFGWGLVGLDWFWGLIGSPSLPVIGTLLAPPANSLSAAIASASLDPHKSALYLIIYIMVLRFVLRKF